MKRLVVFAALASLSPTVAQQSSDRPAPTHTDVRYGEHERNVLDLYLTPSADPTPLVIYIHGGGFRGGDKRSVSARLVRLMRPVMLLMYRTGQTKFC